MSRKTAIVPVEWMELAEAGNANAQAYVGMVYYRNAAVAGHMRIAEKWFRSAAMQGLKEAQLYMGWILGSADQPASARAEARVWLERAALQGEMQAGLKLGIMHIYGIGGARDFEEGLRLIHKAAFEGHLPSQLTLVIFDSCGAPHREPSVEVTRLARKAKSGEIDTRFRLASLLYCGAPEIPPNLEAARRMLRMVARQGHATAEWIVRVENLLAGSAEVRKEQMYDLLAEAARCGSRLALVLLPSRNGHGGSSKN